MDIKVNNMVPAASAGKPTVKRSGSDDHTTTALRSADKTDRIVISAEAHRFSETASSTSSNETSGTESVGSKTFLNVLKTKNEADHVNWDKLVDPDGKIFGEAYTKSLVRQHNDDEAVIRSYYEAAHKENLSFESPYTHILQKYEVESSPYFKSEMSKDERDMALRQERALLWGSNLAVNDPFALAESGGIRNIKEMDEIALKEAHDKINRLIDEKKSEMKKAKIQDQLYY